MIGEKMEDIESISLRFDGDDASFHAIEINALGISLQGFARIASTAAHFAATQKYSKYYSSHDVKILATEPKANCVTIEGLLLFIQQHQIFAGSFGVITATIISYVLARNANKREEMKMLKDSLDKAIQALGNREQSVIDRLLNTIDKMADDLRPAARQVVTPIGKTASTVTISSKDKSVSYTFDEIDAKAINALADDEISGTIPLVILITELDKEKNSCKIHIDGENEKVRFNADITDPITQSHDNPYLNSFVANEWIQVKAKIQYKGGEISKVYISDISS